LRRAAAQLRKHLAGTARDRFGQTRRRRTWRPLAKPDSMPIAYTSKP